MANCNILFSKYHSQISLTSSKTERMKKSKNGLRQRIRAYFKENHPDYHPKFYIQGSYKMKTSIRTKDDICDLDDGVYFFRSPDVSATTLQTWIKNAVDGYTSENPEHRSKCIRNIFANDYEIDIPVYYKIDDKEYQLAIKNTGWQDSDSKAIVNWFNEQKDNDGVLVRIVKYLKGWCDEKRNKMPNGLAMTILASNAMKKISYNSERDDITLKDILKEIQKELDKEFACEVPVTPFDNLFENYDEKRKNNFLSCLSIFVRDAEEAVKETNQLKASKLWRKHLGDRFPEGENKNEDMKQFAGIITGASGSNPWAK